MSHHVLYSPITIYYMKSKQVAFKHMNSWSAFPATLISNIFHMVIKQERWATKKCIISNNEQSGAN